MNSAVLNLYTCVKKLPLLLSTAVITLPVTSLLWRCYRLLNSSSSMSEGRMCDFYSYTRAQLLELRPRFMRRPSLSVRCRIRKLFHPLSYYRVRARGCRAGHKVPRLIPVRLTKQDESSVHWKAASTGNSTHDRAQLIYPKLERHAVFPDRRLRVGFLNIRSVSNKIENVL